MLQRLNKFQQVQNIYNGDSFMNFKRLKILEDKKFSYSLFRIKAYYRYIVYRYLKETCFAHN
jgi:hypothetical protein